MMFASFDGSHRRFPTPHNRATNKDNRFAQLSSGSTSMPGARENVDSLSVNSADQLCVEPGRPLAEAWRDPTAWDGMTEAGGVRMPAKLMGAVALDELPDELDRATVEDWLWRVRKAYPKQLARWSGDLC